MATRPPTIRIKAVTLDPWNGSVQKELSGERRLRSRGITEETVSKALGGKQVKQFLECIDVEGKELWCPFHASNLPAMGDADDPPLVLVEVMEEEEAPEPAPAPAPATDGAVNPELVAYAAVLSAAVYKRDKAEILQFLKTSGANMPALGIKEECLFVSQGAPITFLIAKVDDVIYVVFRGTVNLRDWKTNFTLIPSVPCFEGFLHQGFFDCAKHFPHEVIRIWLQQKRKVVVTGHSLGGAIAGTVTLQVLTQVNTDLRKEPTLLQTITFGAPFFATEGVQHFLKTHRLTDIFHSYVCEQDPVPRLLNLSVDSTSFRLVSELIQTGLDGLSQHAESLLPGKFKFQLPEYAPLGWYYFITGSKEGIQTYAGKEKIQKLLGGPEFSGDWGAGTVAQHDITESYMTRVKAQYADGLNKKVCQVPSLCLGITLPQNIEASESMYQLFDADEGWIDVSIGKLKTCEDAPTHYREYTAHSPSRGCQDKQSVQPFKELEFERCLRYKQPETFGEIKLTCVRQGPRNPKLKSVQIAIKGRCFGEYSICWLWDVSIDGLELDIKEVQRQMLDDDKLHCKVWIAADVRYCRYGSILVKEWPLNVKCMHLLCGELSTESRHFRMMEPVDVDGLPPYQTILDIQSPLLLEIALKRVVLEVFLGTSLPEDKRAYQLTTHPVMSKITKLEKLVSDQENIQDCLLDGLRFHAEDEVEPISCSGTVEEKASKDERLLRFLKTVVKDTADDIKKILEFVFDTKSISACWSNWSRKDIARATVVGGLAGAAVVTGVWACGMGGMLAGFVARAAAAEIMLGVSVGAAGGAVVGYSLAEVGHKAEIYKKALEAFILNLDGDVDGLPPTCFQFEQHLDHLVCERLRNAGKMDMIEPYVKRRFALNRKSKSDSKICPDDMHAIWVQQLESGVPPIANATRSSKELFARHLFTVQLMGDIRKDLVATTWIAVVGIQNAGKSTLVKTLWPTAPVKGLGGADQHTTLPNPCRISEDLVIVDFPGVDDWANLAFVTERFLQMATMVVVLVQAEHIAEHEIALVKSVKDQKKEQCLMVCANQIDRFVDRIPTPEKVQQLIDIYAAADRLNVASDKVHLTAMRALGPHGTDDANVMNDLVERGIKGPEQVRKELSTRLQGLLDRDVSL